MSDNDKPQETFYTDEEKAEAKNTAAQTLANTERAETVQRERLREDPNLTKVQPRQKS